VYSSGTAIFKIFGWIRTVSGLQAHHHFPQKSKTEWGTTRDFFQRDWSNIFHKWDWRHKRSLATALQILLTLPVSVASCERSFSKMKLIKSYLRSTMSQQDRFTSLAILSIENEVDSSIDFSDVIKDFVAIKSRKVQF
jgi:hypothetical protein